MTQLDRPLTSTRFDRLFADHHAAIRRYCLRRLPPELADDAAADVFVTAWRRIDDVPEVDEALLWLYGVARNVVWRAKRGSTRRRRLAARARSAVDPGSELPEAVVVRSAEEAELLAAIAQLGPDDRELLRLKAWEELSHADIAKVLGLSVTAVDARASRAMKRLQRIVLSGGSR